MGKRRWPRRSRRPRDLLQFSHMALPAPDRPADLNWQGRPSAASGVMGSPSLEVFGESLGNPTSACSEGTPLVRPALSSPPVLAVLTLTLRHSSAALWGPGTLRSWDSQPRMRSPPKTQMVPLGRDSGAGAGSPRLCGSQARPGLPRPHLQFILKDQDQVLNF